jgi:hypothetical protein
VYVGAVNGRVNDALEPERAASAVAARGVVQMQGPVGRGARHVLQTSAEGDERSIQIVEPCATEAGVEPGKQSVKIMLKEWPHPWKALFLQLVVSQERRARHISKAKVQNEAAAEIGHGIGVAAVTPLVRLCSFTWRRQGSATITVRVTCGADSPLAASRAE